MIFTILMAVLLLVAALFAGCGGDSAAPGEGDGGNGSTGGGPISQAEATSCAANRKTISAAAQQYYNFEGTYPASIQVLVPDYLMSVPVCPSGGRYTLQGSTVTCSVHGS